MYVFIGQINDLFDVHAAGHLESPHFAQVIFVLVGDDVAAGEALDGNDHCNNGFSGGSNCCIMALFLNQFLKIRHLFILVSSAFFYS